ncbi:cell division protein SepF [Pseudostreptobacillus hongkongensis]|uniref:cell division protein SepF n=1 Tax=Pseudostreptobacillus hongkongensis TaxID=1162717 RepID=UPI000831C79C|nr:cell division protein SepF [Pseudostreptobacillus hongkongensis]
MGFFSNWFKEDDEDIIDEKVEVKEEKPENKIKFFSKREEEVKVMSNLKYVVLKPQSIVDSQTIVNLIKEKAMVTFSIENLNREEGQRLYDIAAGATSAMNGRIEAVTDKVVTSVPEGVLIENLIKKSGE